eukprot:scaffold4656_cov117-Isochrysis_galbana.AAC.6
MELRRPPGSGRPQELQLKSSSRGRPNADIHGDISAGTARAARGRRSSRSSSPCAVVGPDGPASAA